MTREDELIHRMEQGDADAIDELIEQFYPEILRYCLWHAPNRSLAEDATQELPQILALTCGEKVGVPIYL